MYILWIIVLVTAVIAEAATFALISLWFAIGALAALIAAFLGAGQIVQVIIFFVVSFGSLAATRPVLKKLMPDKYIPTNGELDIGRTAVVIETVNPSDGIGRVRIDGVDWGAVSADGSVIEEGAVVVIKAKGAARLTVERAK